MTTTGLCQFLRVLDASGTVLHSMQNYWIGQTVDGHAFEPFRVDGAVASSSADQNGLKVAFVNSAANYQLTDAAFRQGQLIEVQFKRFTPEPGGGPPASMTVVAKVLGEIVKVSSTLDEISMDVGSALDPIAAQIPPRVFTATLIGAPPRK